MRDRQHARGVTWDLTDLYASVDDPQAQEARQRLKYYEPDCLMLGENKSTSRTLAGLREIQKAILTGVSVSAKRISK